MAGFTLHGPARLRLRSLALLFKSTCQVALRRAMGVSHVPDWPWDVETGVLFWRKQMEYAFSLPDIRDARAVIDSLVFDPPSPMEVKRTHSRPGEPKGCWITPKHVIPGRTLLYFHGGGYAHYARSHKPLQAYVASAVRARTLALDYRLTPEHPYPAQLEDALAAYRWLLHGGVAPTDILMAGDSAGGHLVLATLIALREAGLPQPALGIGICPWTHIGHRGKSLFENDQYDWVQGYMALKFGEWLRGDSGLSAARLSPINGDLKGLAPLYLQAGGREILHDMIADFAREASKQGAEVALDVWATMPHDFQAFGNHLAESRDALARIGAMADIYLTRARLSLA